MGNLWPTILGEASGLDGQELIEVGGKVLEETGADACC
jgi:hypothetical protein